ncbi:MAG: calcium-binding protein [Pseudorhodobacter sp.]|nr:MAG: calcium-binding protein [Pseudorhodobacter sp.]
MTTFTLRGVTVTEGANGSPSSVVQQNLVIRATDNYRLQYERIAPLEANDLAVIDLFPGVGDDYQVAVGSARPGPGWEAMIGTVTWNGHKSQVLILDHEASSNKWTMVQLGGYPLPPMTTPAQVQALFDAMSGLSGNLTGALAPNTNIDLRSLTAFVSANENDVIIANGQYDNWAGRTISTGIGNDKVAGVSANDRFVLGSGNDTGIGGSGSDSIFGGTGKDSLLGESGADLLYGGDQDDYGFGGTGNDRIYGDAGNDSLDGGHDADLLSGGAGNDRMLGGIGADTLTGGLGEDNFRFRKGDDADRITDFANNTDTLVLQGFGAGFTVNSALAKAVNITGGVRFDFGGGDVVTVMGVTKSAIADDIFIL